MANEHDDIEAQFCLSMSNKRPLPIMRLLGLDSAQKSATDMFKAAKRLAALFPRVPQTDAILFTVQCHGLSNGEICFLSTNGVQDDNSHD